MIISMRRCVTCDDLWPSPISSRSFDLDLENCVRSVASAVLDGFLLYLAQMITIIRGGDVACYVFFKIWKFEFLANFWNFSALTLKKNSTVLDGFFPYLSQMITSMRECVAYNDLWPWSISSRSFSLGLENHVRSVASTVPDGFFPYLVQMITDSFYIWHKWSLSLGGVSRVTFFSKSGNLNFWQIFEFFGLDLEKKILQFSMDSFHIYHKWSLVWESVLHTMTFDLDLYLQGHLALALKIMSAL